MDRKSVVSDTLSPICMTESQSPRQFECWLSSVWQTSFHEYICIYIYIYMWVYRSIEKLFTVFLRDAHETTHTREKHRRRASQRTSNAICNRKWRSKKNHRITKTNPPASNWIAVNFVFSTHAINCRSDLERYWNYSHSTATETETKNKTQISIRFSRMSDRWIFTMNLIRSIKSSLERSTTILPR